jgi:hypothetical protein
VTPQLERSSRLRKLGRTEFCGAGSHGQRSSDRGLFSSEACYTQSRRPDSARSALMKEPTVTKPVTVATRASLDTSTYQNQSTLTVYGQPAVVRDRQPVVEAAEVTPHPARDGW